MTAAISCHGTGARRSDVADGATSAAQADAGPRGSRISFAFSFESHAETGAFLSGSEPMHLHRMTGYFGLTHLLQDSRIDSAGALRLFLYVLLPVCFDGLR